LALTPLKVAKTRAKPSSTNDDVVDCARPRAETPAPAALGDERCDHLVRDGAAPRQEVDGRPDRRDLGRDDSARLQTAADVEGIDVAAGSAAVAELALIPVVGGAIDVEGAAPAVAVAVVPEGNVADPGGRRGLLAARGDPRWRATVEDSAPLRVQCPRGRVVVTLE